jgi:hypothetical protein
MANASAHASVVEEAIPKDWARRHDDGGGVEGSDWPKDDCGHDAIA